MSGPDGVQLRKAATITAQRERHPADDVVAARDGVRNASVPYGPRTPARQPASGIGDQVRGFVRRYGWRAYALPVLLVITVAALMTTTTARTTGRSSGGGKAKAGPAVAPSQISLKDDAPGANVDDTVLKAAALPDGESYTFAGKGTYRVLKGTSPVVGRTGQLFRYSVDVENGVDDIDLTAFQKSVVSVLSDKRSWSGHGMRVQRVDSGRIDFHITMTSSKTVRTLCGYNIHVETSCYVTAGSVDGADVNRVVFNDSRWARGSAAYVGDLASYRTYMINHENGHAMGHQHAHQCLPGGLAPAMMQQTFGLRSAATKQLCQANPWPYPADAVGVPGAEQPDTRANDEYGLGD